jgi:DNA-directed RNA polymerase specialized sigma24 family protein
MVTTQRNLPSEDVITATLRDELLPLLLESNDGYPKSRVHVLDEYKKIEMILRKCCKSRRKTKDAAAIRSEAACQLYLDHSLPIDLIADLMQMSGRSISRFIDAYLQKANAKNFIAERKTAKAELNNYFGLLGQSASLSEIRVSDDEYLTRLLATLTRTQAQTFIAFYYDWHSIEQIAHDEGVSTTAIERRLTRIRRAFANAGLPRPARGQLPREIRPCGYPIDAI